MTVVLQGLIVLGLLLGAFSSSYYLGVGVASLIDWIGDKANW